MMWQVGDLSGGERNRVHLAKVMKGRCVASEAVVLVVLVETFS